MRTTKTCRARIYGKNTLPPISRSIASPPACRDGLLRIEGQATIAGAAGFASSWSIPRATWPRAGTSWTRSTPAARPSSTPRWWSACRRPPASSPSSGRQDRAGGFIPFVAHTEDDVAVNARPPQDIGKPLVIAAAQGERPGAQVGLYPLARLDGVKVTVGNLVCTSTGNDPPPRIPASHRAGPQGPQLPERPGAQPPGPPVALYRPGVPDVGSAARRDAGPVADDHGPAIHPAGALRGLAPDRGRRQVNRDPDRASNWWCPCSTFDGWSC